LPQKPIGQRRPCGRHALARYQDGGLVAAELFFGGLAHDVGHRRLGSGDQGAQDIHEAAFGLMLDRAGQIFPTDVTREVDGVRS
jgi:hypothetical protein